MDNDIINLSKKLISIKSVHGNEEALNQALRVATSGLTDFTIERFENNGIKSVLAYNFKKRPEKFKVILNGHLDVVPGKQHQYQPRIKYSKLYGNGALDMKANLACLLTVFKDVASKLSYPLGLQLVTDEEVGGSNGTRYQIKKGVRADFVIAGETTNFNIVNKAKGVLWLKILTNGETAHGAYPWRGKNSILDMNKFITELLKKYPIPDQEKWVTTVNLSRIQTTNKTFNKIPDNCEIWLDIRYIPEEGDIIIDTIKKMLPYGFKLEILVKEPAINIDENNQYIQKLKMTGEKVINRRIKLYGAQGTSDLRHFAQVGCSGVEFGAIGEGIGSDHEWIDINSLEKYRLILKNFLLSL